MVFCVFCKVLQHESGYLEKGRAISGAPPQAPRPCRAPAAVHMIWNKKMSGLWVVYSFASVAISSDPFWCVWNIRAMCVECVGNSRNSCKSDKKCHTLLSMGFKNQKFGTWLRHTYCSFPDPCYWELLFSFQIYHLGRQEVFLCVRIPIGIYFCHCVKRN